MPEAKWFSFCRPSSPPQGDACSINLFIHLPFFICRYPKVCSSLFPRPQKLLLKDLSLLFLLGNIVAGLFWYWLRDLGAWLGLNICQIVFSAVLQKDMSDCRNLDYSFLLGPHSSAGQSHHLYQHRYSCVHWGWWNEELILVKTWPPGPLGTAVWGRRASSLGSEGPRVGKGGTTTPLSFSYGIWWPQKYIKQLPGKSGVFTFLLSTFYRTEPKISHLISTLLNSSELHSTLPLSIIYANSVPLKLSIIYLSSSTGCILSVNVKGRYPKNVPCFALRRILYLCWP